MSSIDSRAPSFEFRVDYAERERRTDEQSEYQETRRDCHAKCSRRTRGKKGKKEGGCETSRAIVDDRSRPSIRPFARTCARAAREWRTKWNRGRGKSTSDA